MNNTSSTIIADTGLTTEEITTASRHLSVTRGFLLESVGGLSRHSGTSNPQATPGRPPRTWSTSCIVESGIHAIIEGMNEAPGHHQRATGAKWMNSSSIKYPSVPGRVKASAQACPTGRWTGPEALQQFVQCREQSIRLLVSRRLRAHVFPHPLFGPWDGYQWLLAAASHGARHTEQIREVKADRNFPQA